MATTNWGPQHMGTHNFGTILSIPTITGQPPWTDAPSRCTSLLPSDQVLAQCRLSVDLHDPIKDTDLMCGGIVPECDLDFREVSYTKNRECKEVWQVQHLMSQNEGTTILRNHLLLKCEAMACLQLSCSFHATTAGVIFLIIK